jgi:hypothetical protein
MKTAYKILVRRTEQKKPLWSTKYRWMDYVRLDLKEIGCELDSSD